MKNIKNNTGFSILEVAIAMAVTAILISAVTPSVINAIQIKAAEKTALEIAIIEDAARNFFIKKDKWPKDSIELQQSGFLNINWEMKNPWDKPYLLSAQQERLSISTEIPDANWRGLVAKYLPAGVVKESIVISSISKTQESTIEDGVIVAWHGTIASIPKGWLLCDGNNGTPNLMDKFIVGASKDISGESQTSVMTLSPSDPAIFSKSGGTIQHNHSGATGGHVLTIDEMPKHQHSGWGEAFPDEAPWGVAPGGAGHIGDGHSDRDNYYYLTSPEGGNQKHSHTISLDYNIPPYYALAFIMKSS